MSSVLGYNKGTVGGTFLDEQILKDDELTTTIAVSVSRAVIDHLIYYLRSFFSDTIFQYSATSDVPRYDRLLRYKNDISNSHLTIVKT